MARDGLYLYDAKSQLSISVCFYFFTIVPDIRLIRVAIVMERQWKNTAVGEVKIISHRTGEKISVAI